MKRINSPPPAPNDSTPTPLSIFELRDAIVRKLFGSILLSPTNDDTSMAVSNFREFMLGLQLADNLNL